MERNFTDENFEEFLQRNSDSLRMRPSDKVWRKITAQLYRRRRFTILTSVFLLTTTALGYYLSNQHTPSAEFTTTQHKIVTGEPANKLTSLLSTPGQTQKTYLSDLSALKSVASDRHRLPVLVTPQTFPAFLSPAPWNEPPAESFVPSIVDEYEPVAGTTPAASSERVATSPEYPLTIESVVNSYQAPRKHKFGLQINFTPTISYRKLSENKSYLRSVPQLNVPYNFAALYNVNDIVTSKPNMGFEIGLTTKYPLTRKVNLTGGIQFNVNRYDLKVFHDYMGVATIALNTGRSVDSVRALTNYSSTNTGYGSDWLQNFFFEVSTPIGVEVMLKGDDKTQFGLATAIQPTYVLGDRVYLISTDYKNYAQVPWLTRNWNVNTNLQAYISYSTGHFRWQVGPQVRYQLLSSFINKYPVKENLFDFGLKVGISLNHY